MSCCVPSAVLRAVATAWGVGSPQLRLWDPERRKRHGAIPRGSAESTINSAVDVTGRWKLLWTVKDEEFGQPSGGQEFLP